MKLTQEEKEGIFFKNAEALLEMNMDAQMDGGKQL